MLAYVEPNMSGPNPNPNSTFSFLIFFVQCSPDVSKMRNLVMGFGRGKARKTSAAKARQLDMLEQMKAYCEEEGVCRR